MIETNSKVEAGEEGGLYVSCSNQQCFVDIGAKYQERRVPADQFIPRIPTIPKKFCELPGLERAGGNCISVLPNQTSSNVPTQAQHFRSESQLERDSSPDRHAESQVVKEDWRKDLLFTDARLDLIWKRITASILVLFLVGVLLGSRALGLEHERDRIVAMIAALLSLQMGQVNKSCKEYKRVRLLSDPARRQAFGANCGKGAIAEVGKKVLNDTVSDCTFLEQVLKLISALRSP